MKITIESPAPDEEDEIIIRCKNPDNDLIGFICKFKKKHNKVIGYHNKNIIQIEPQEIYYFESVDNKVFAYCEKEIYEVKLKLYEIEYVDFLRISKSAVLNLSKVKSIQPLFNGRFEASLKNGERIIISRQYVSDLKRALGIGR